MGVRNIMEYSIFTSVDYMLEAFESIDRIDVSLTRDNKRLRRFILIIDIVIMILQ